jgi:1-deoxy-D-xylulose-5-phosphate synthase
MGIVYIGPIDGHNIGAISKALRLSQKTSGPVLLHAVTQKGRGYAPAEMQPDVFHGVGCYDPNTGDFKPSAASPTFTSVFSQALLEQARRDPRIVAITAAMTDGTGLAPFREELPERFVDVGIAEEHAVALAGGLALGGKLPVVAIYSTFLQRAFDQIVIDVALQEQHAVFCVDRAGLVGEDGSTHHGLFDLAYLRSIPGMRVMAPADREQLVDALHTALLLDGGPVALRYPRGEAPVPDAFCDEGGTPRVLPLGKATKLREGSDVSLLAVGRMVTSALEVAALLAERGIEAAVYNMLWVKPVDKDAVLEAAAAPLVVTLEEGTVVGGFGTAVLEVLARASVEPSTASSTAYSLEPLVEAPRARVLNIGVPDDFVGHGSIEQLFEEVGLTGPQIAERIGHVLARKDQAD